MAVPTLKVGDTVLTPTRRLPSSAFKVNSIKKLSVHRSQSGKLLVQKLYEKHSIRVSGVSLDLFESLRFEYQRDDFIDLYSIGNRKEVFTGTGTTTILTTSRRLRLDDSLVAPILHHPPGTTITTGITFSNTLTQGVVTVNPPLNLSSGNAVVFYYPIYRGTIAEFDSDYDWTGDEESWSFTFEEE